MEYETVQRCLLNMPMHLTASRGYALKSEPMVVAEKPCNAAVCLADLILLPPSMQVEVEKIVHVNVPGPALPAVMKPRH